MEACTCQHYDSGIIYQQKQITNNSFELSQILIPDMIPNSVLSHVFGLAWAKKAISNIQLLSFDRPSDVFVYTQ